MCSPGFEQAEIQLTEQEPLKRCFGRISLIFSKSPAKTAFMHAFNDLCTMTMSCKFYMKSAKDATKAQYAKMAVTTCFTPFSLYLEQIS